MQYNVHQVFWLLVIQAYLVALSAAANAAPIDPVRHEFSEL